MTWISVKDKLPETGERIILAYKSGTVKESPAWAVEFSEYVTHWMPMPDHPAKQNTNQ
jgi:hypothetical protein